MSRILIVGGSGFLGLHTARGLAADGHEVFATHTFGREPPALPTVRWVPCDVVAGDGLSQLPLACDAVFYLAQSRRWRDFPQDAPSVFAVNLAGLFAVAWYARRCGAKMFCYASSGTVYSQTSAVAREDERIDLNAPRSFYAASKLSAELLLRPFEAVFPVVQFRLFSPYGSFQSPDMLLPTLVRNVRCGRQIKLHGETGLWTNPVAVADVVEAFRRAIQLPSSHTLNIAGPQLLNLRSLAQTIGQQVNREPLFISQPGDVPIIAGDTTCLEQAFAWKPATLFADGLAQWLREELALLAAA